jgi:hypothetical protein
MRDDLVGPAKVQPVVRNLAAFFYRHKPGIAHTTNRNPWGRPNNPPERVTLENPLLGDNETMERTLLGQHESKT